MEGMSYTSLAVFVAGPDDVRDERDEAERVIRDVDLTCREPLGVRPECVRWERMTPLASGPREGMLQNRFTRKVRTCQVFVLIVNKRYGTTKSGEPKSNTHLEVDAALEMLDRGEDVRVLAYAHKLAANNDPGEQEKKLVRLIKCLKKRGVLFRTYNDASDFARYFTHDLYAVLLEFRLATPKQRALRCFWRLGVTEGQDHPRVTMIYPPVDRSFMRQEENDTIWHQRLVPDIVFEDFKALHKLDKTLRLLGHQDIATQTTATFPEDVYDMNRVWFCLPRSQPAQKRLESYRDETRFRFVADASGSPRRIIWMPSSSSRASVEVESPLTAYLSLQREPAGGPWRPEHPRIYAKDYAILARFTDRSGHRPTVRGTLKEYFVGGIRGLGTWGAGWYVDRMYDKFLPFEDSEDCSIQMLLEVTYLNEQIANVEDVSNRTADYFRNEMSVETIRGHIDEQRQRSTQVPL